MPTDPASMRWLPHVTVAAIIERDGRFLCVEEKTETGVVFNQPAGHLEEGETLVQAIQREVLEETTHGFQVAALTGIYQYRSPGNGITYLRFCFSGTVAPPNPHALLDTGIIAARWFSREELICRSTRLRSPMVVQCIDDYLAGQRLPLAVLHLSR